MLRSSVVILLLFLSVGLVNAAQAPTCGVLERSPLGGASVQPCHHPSYGFVSSPRDEIQLAFYETNSWMGSRGSRDQPADRRTDERDQQSTKRYGETSAVSGDSSRGSDRDTRFDDFDVSEARGRSDEDDNRSRTSSSSPSTLTRSYETSGHGGGNRIVDFVYGDHDGPRFDRESARRWLEELRNRRIGDGSGFFIPIGTDPGTAPEPGEELVPSPVPLPPAFLMLLAPLFAFGFLRRRQQA
ncbi:hypothetical protein SAMN05421688_0815 [Poseidonocella pacifica]|uniref:VPLPA-CTERM protein sorting domain-containing protein n=1 Tax=Poseidonocella pacifica TaxID=871651 RepID=A0A1I0VNQ3_9RHOB|nr:hypothetical protein [Poseidonocella pacifica]SFA77921.1 hypothetical protein SAMN05421688_0815 [Poseidonocella pacifica]